MKTERADSELGEPNVAWADNAWTRFWFTPIPTTGLHVLRFVSGLLFFAWLASFLGHQAEYFGPNGWLDLDALRQVRGKGDIAPAPIGWSMLYLAGDNVQQFQAMYFGALVVLALFALGIATRLTGILTWVIVVSFLANPATSFEGDYLLAILAFYLMIGHLLLGQWNGNLSPAERIVGSRHDFILAGWLFPRPDDEQPLSASANFTLRLMQIHFAIIIVTSALHKLQIAEWWSGVAFWYPLHPTFQTTLDGIKREAPGAQFTLFYLSLVQYVVLAWQLCLPLFAWRTGWWRGVLLGGAAVGWLGMVFVYGLPLFGPFVAIGCLSYLRPEEWAWLRERLAAALAQKAPAETKKIAVAAGKENIKK